MDSSWIQLQGAPGLVSVLIPAYNAQETISTTLDSVAKQTYRPVEVILIDDGSTDGTGALIRTWADSMQGRAGFAVRVLHQGNRGLLACRNRATEEARGEFFQYLDADDLLHPEKLARCVEAMRLNMERAVVVPRTRLFEQEEDLGDDREVAPKKRPWSEEETGAPTIARQFWYTVGPLFHRSVVVAAGSFPPDVHPVAEEAEFHARVKCVAHSVRYLPEILAFRRVGQKTQLTHPLPQLYQGKVNAMSWMAKVMESHGITDDREWRCLFRHLVSTAYAIAACSYDATLFRDAYGMMRSMSRSRWPLVYYLLRVLSPGWFVLCSRMVYRMRA